MSEIGSFNELFAEAARAELLLQAFHQLPNGRWLASWRRGSGPGATHYPPAEAERPFNAMLRALEFALDATTVKTDPTIPRDEVRIVGVYGDEILIKNVVPIEDDLFA